MWLALSSAYMNINDGASVSVNGSGESRSQEGARRDSGRDRGRVAGQWAAVGIIGRHAGALGERASRGVPQHGDARRIFEFGISVLLSGLEQISPRQR
jgi:hypothetical protein